MAKTVTDSKKIVTSQKSGASTKTTGSKTTKKTSRKITAAEKKTGPAKITAKAGIPPGRTKKGNKEKKTMTRYRCRVCGYIYSPFRGEPHHGIPAGTAFEDLPDTYVCTVCGMEGKGKIGKWGFEEWRPTRYVCTVCSYVYDEKRGEPHHGIKAGTKFEDLPDDYVCTVCALDPKIKVQFGKVFKQGFEPLHL